MCGSLFNPTSLPTTQETKSAAAPQLSSFISDIGNLRNIQYNPATQQQIAPFSAQQQQGFNQVDANQGAWQPYSNQASSYATQGAAPVTTADVMSHYNPMIDAQVESTQADFNAQNARQNAGVNANAAKVGALGGTQSIVARNLAMESQNRTQNPIIAGMRANAFNTALGAAQADRGASQYGAGAFSALGNQRQQQGNVDVASLFNSGGMQQTQQQNILNANSANAAAQSAYPWQSAYGYAGLLNPAASTLGSTTTGQQYGPSLGQTLVGAAAAGAGAYMASDERVKHDVSRVGATFDGQPIYTFKYNGSPTTQMGLLAQDVEKSKPDAVAEIGGVKHVDYDRATARTGKADGGEVSPGFARMAAHVKHAVDVLSPFKQNGGMAAGGAVNNGPIMPYAGASSYIPPGALQS